MLLADDDVDDDHRQHFHCNQQDLLQNQQITTNNKWNKSNKNCVGIEGNLLTCTQNNFVKLMF